MQGLVNFATASGDAIVGSLPAACYVMACISFFYFAWTLWTWSAPHSASHHLRPFEALVAVRIPRARRRICHLSSVVDPPKRHDGHIGRCRSNQL